MWTTQGFPVNNDSEEDEGLRKTGTTLDNGTVFRVLELAPGARPRNHRTDSIDYAVVMSGEIDMELDGSTVHLKAGDVLVQRGTIHNWVNRGGVPCVIAFVLIAGIIAAKLLAGREDWVLAHRLPGRPAMTAWGFVIGLASSLMGISGGSLGTMMLTLCGKPLHNAVATSAGIGVPITVAGTLGYVLAGLPHHTQLPALSVGFVSVIGVALIAPISS